MPNLPYMATRGRAEVAKLSEEPVEGLGWGGGGGNPENNPEQKAILFSKG